MSFVSFTLALVANTPQPVLTLGSTSGGVINKTTGTYADPVPLMVGVPNGGVLSYVGGLGVTPANGFPIQPGSSVPFEITTDALYVVSAGAATINVIVGRQ